jgi:hypothetical protein
MPLQICYCVIRPAFCLVATPFLAFSQEALARWSRCPSTQCAPALVCSGIMNVPSGQSSRALALWPTDC